MNRKGAETVLIYFRDIPGMFRILRKEKEELEELYNGLHATACDGLPHGWAPGKPTESLAVRIAESGAYERLQEIRVRMDVLAGDALTVRGALDDMSAKYKTLLNWRILHGYSWGKISVRMGAPESTVRYWFKMALSKLAEILSEAPMADELELRASRARSL